MIFSLSAADIPQVSTSREPIWYRIQLPSWSDPSAQRSQRFLSSNGVNPITILPTAVNNSDVNLWRLDGSALTNVRLVSRSGDKEVRYAASANKTQGKFTASNGGSAFEVYSSEESAGGYYFGMVGSNTYRMNACGVLAEWPEVYPFGLTMWNENDMASTWLFTRIYSSKITVSVEAARGSVYVGQTAGVTTAEVMSGMTAVLHAVPNEGFIFKEWKKNGTRVSGDAAYSITIPSLTANADVTYIAVFDKDIVTRTATPTFLNDKSVFKIGSEAIVQVNCSEASAIIYYTLDGSEPTIASSVVTDGKIRLNSSSVKTYTVKIAAKSSGLDISRVVSSDYSIVSTNAPAALLPIPNERQLFYMKHPHAAFIHYGMNTYTGVEWGSGRENCASFNPPKEVDTDQWASVLKECGFDRVVLTGKHHDGFCLWPSQANRDKPHTIAQSPYKGGKGDLFEQLSLSCTKVGLDMGVYLSPWDAYEENIGGHYTSALYNDFYNAQLIEVLSKYGRYNEKLGRREIVEIWLDGATGSYNPPVYDFNRFTNTMRQYQPSAFIWIDAIRSFQTCVAKDTCKVDGAWAMNESGQAPDPCWNKMSTDGSSTDGCKNKPNGKFSFLLEADVSIRGGWFYGNGGGLKSAIDLFKERYLKSIGRGVPLILNIPPDRNGVFAEPYVAVLRKYKEYLDTTFGNDLIPSTAVASATQVRADDESFSAAKVLDDNYDTYWTMNDGQTTGTITVDFGEEKRFDIVQFQEYVPLGQRVSGWRVDVNVNGKWQEFGTGTTIGFKRIFKGKEVQASGVRLAITGSLAVPLINALAVYRSHKDLIDSDLPPIVGTDGQFSVAADYMTAHETDASVTVKILLKSRSEKPVNVYVATLPGTGVQGKVYQDKTETITFERGVTEKEFTVNLINNGNAEGDKDFYIEISNPSLDATIGIPSKTRVWVVDDENPSKEYTISISSVDAVKGNVAIVYPENYTGKTISATTPVQIEARPEDGYSFVKWVNEKTGVTVSMNARYVYDAGNDISLKAYFDETYPIMKRTFTNDETQQNRYLKSVRTTAAKTPVIFNCSSESDLPYTPFPAASIGTFIPEGALVDKRNPQIELDYGTKSFAMTFYGWTAAIGGREAQLNWTQQACFIDWNKNGRFTDAGEIYPKSSNTIGNDGGVCASFLSSAGYTRTISVPDGQAPGTYRMRIAYLEPQDNAAPWQNTLFSTDNMQLRNGISYDFTVNIDVPKGVQDEIVSKGMSIYSIKGAIVCNIDKSSVVSVYNAAGAIVKQLVVDGKEIIPVESGVYIVNASGESVTIYVR
ncbi:MAG: alpha-L-fucosidase [Bacteroidales bacterium]